VSTEWADQLRKQHRAVRLRLGGEDRLVAASDSGMYRDGVGASLPPGLPEAYTESVEQPLEQLLLRWAATHVPFLPSDPATRWSLPLPLLGSTLDAMVNRGDLIAGLFRPGSHEREYCSPEVLRILRRRSLARLRKEIEPVEPVILARFQPAWQGVGFQARGIERLAEVIGLLQGAAIPVSVLERDVLASRMTGYTPQLLDELIGMGEVV